MADSALHRHAAFQIAIAVRGEASIVDAAGTCHRAAALIVPPMTGHRLLASPDLLTFFVEPQSALADRLRELCGDGVTAADDLRGLREVAAGSRSGMLDPRLVAAMDTVATQDLSMPDLAARVGLSPQRLRALARQQLGMPLTRWRVWTRLRRAAEALRDGRTLADAALTGGFADQAHFTRQMRAMMGLTPATVLPLLLDAPRRSRSTR